MLVKQWPWRKKCDNDSNSKLHEHKKLRNFEKLWVNLYLFWWLSLQSPRNVKAIGLEILTHVTNGGKNTPKKNIGSLSHKDKLKTTYQESQLWV